MQRFAMLVLLLALLPPPAVHAAVRVVPGPTPIVDGDAKSAGDITIVNEKLAFALGIGSPVPYGVPRGAIVDVAPVVNGRIGRDCVVFADFIPNNWSAWPNTFHRVDVLENGPARAVVRTVRDWGKVTITTLYTLASNSDSIAIHTTMSNGGDTLPGLLSGLTLWPRGGHFFGLPGMEGVTQGATVDALADRVVAYDESWTVALHAPYADRFADGALDLYRLHTLPAGGSRAFDAWLQVGARGDMQPVVAAEIERKHLASGVVRGAVAATDGRPVETPVVIVERQGKPYAWVLGRHGRYEARLPVGNYALYATARNHSQTAPTPVQIVAGAAAVRDFRDLQGPGNIHWSVTDGRGRPLDARIGIVEGQKPWVGFLGRTTFFTELDRKGRAVVPMAPGPYTFKVSAGAGFLSEPKVVTLTVSSGRVGVADVAVAPLFDPASAHWYSADLHHHADQAEAVTPPAELARSQLAAGLDVLFVSDHDSTVNHRRLQAIAESRGVTFVAGIEISPSWGHFNAYPVVPGRELRLDTATATIDDVLGEGRRLGATVIQVNHPFIPYGYLTSVSAGVAPGGFNPAFDLLEINAEAPGDDAKVLDTLWNFWNGGHRYYLSAGTDTHDVWRDESGAIRVFVHIDEAVTAQSFARALKAGHAYVTSGPLIFPEVVFGDELRVRPGQPYSLEFDLKSVAGIKQAELTGSGAKISSRKFDAAPQQAHIAFPLVGGGPGWYSLMVEDIQGHKAYTNPIWIVPP